MIDFYGGAGTFASLPAQARDYAVATTPVNILDWASGYGFQVSPGRLKEVDVPARVICGELSHPAVKRANELLSIHLPDASFSTISNAAHSMISTASDSGGRHRGKSANRETTSITRGGVLMNTATWRLSACCSSIRALQSS